MAPPLEPAVTPTKKICSLSSLWEAKIFNRKRLEITLSYHNHSITLSLPFAFKTQKKVASGPYDTREIRFFRIVSKSAWFPCTTLVRFSTNNNGSAAMPNPTAIICNLLWCKCACHSRPAARLSSPKFNLLSH